jgi:F0F1-type ATP synthase membrane subunit b/b'
LETAQTFVTRSEQQIEDLKRQMVDQEEAVRREAHEARAALEAAAKETAQKIYTEARDTIHATHKDAEVRLAGQLTEARRHIDRETAALAVRMLEKMLERRLP